MWCLKSVRAEGHETENGDADYQQFKNVENLVNEVWELISVAGKRKVSVTPSGAFFGCGPNHEIQSRS